jgi:hypothetical protein
MMTTRLTALTLAALLGASALPALADNSTGPTNPSSTSTGTNSASGALPGTVGVPTGTSGDKRNANTDGSLGTPAAAPKGDVTVPHNGVNSTDTNGNGTGSEGAK